MMKTPVLIGLCGRSGVGKGYVCGLFAERGIPSIDTDAVYRTMTAPAPELSPCMRELSEAFGESIVMPDHSLNRRAMSEIVFAPDGAEARETLNRITHAHILRETMRLAEEYAAQGARFVIIDAPLLFESGFDRMCRFTVCVCASEDASVSRIIKRDGITEEAARARLAAQIPTDVLRQRCDFAIENELHCETLREQISAVTAELERRCGAER